MFDCSETRSVYRLIHIQVLNFFFSRTSNLFQNSNKVDVLVLSHSKRENLFLRTCLQLFKTCVLSCKFLKFNHLKCVVFILFDWLCCLHTWMIVITLNE